MIGYRIQIRSININIPHYQKKSPQHTYRCNRCNLCLGSLDLISCDLMRARHSSSSKACCCFDRVSFCLDQSGLVYGSLRCGAVFPLKLLPLDIVGDVSYTGLRAVNGGGGASWPNL